MTKFNPRRPLDNANPDGCMESDLDYVSNNIGLAVSLLDNLGKVGPLSYRNSDGAPQTVKGCSLRQDKAGRYWLWCESTGTNLAYMMRTKEDCLLASIDSLLFSISLKNERIAKLQRIADLADRFADEIKPDEEPK